METHPTKDESYAVKASRPGLISIAVLVAFAVFFMFVMSQVHV